MQRVLQSLGQHRLLGGAIVLAITQFVASAAGLVRDSLIARTFPDFGVADVYYASFRPSDLLFQVGIMSAMGTILVPLLASHKAHGRFIDRDALLSGTMATGSLLFGAMAIVLAVVFPFIAPLFVQFTGESLELYVTFGRMALLTNFLFVMGNACGQYLITEQRYWVYGLTPIVYTIGTILGTVFLTPMLGALGPMAGTLIGAFVYTAVRFSSILAHGFRIRARLWHPDLAEMGVLMLPRMLALGALQIQLLFFDRIASGLDAGSITINAFARNFQSVIVGVAGIAVAQSAYSLLSQAAAKSETLRFRMYVRKGTVLLLAVTIPGAIVLVLLGPVIARVMHVTQVLPVFVLALGIYALSIPFESINHLLLRAYYATKNTFIPAVFSVMSGIVAVACAAATVGRLGVYSLGVGYVAGAVVLAAGLAAFLPARVRTIAPSPTTIDPIG